MLHSGSTDESLLPSVFFKHFLKLPLFPRSVTKVAMAEIFPGTADLWFGFTASSEYLPVLPSDRLPVAIVPGIGGFSPCLIFLFSPTETREASVRDPASEGDGHER